MKEKECAVWTTPLSTQIFHRFHCALATRMRMVNLTLCYPMWITIIKQGHDLMSPPLSKGMATNLRLPRFLGSIHNNLDSSRSRHSAQSSSL